jgi:hypothetical protein
MSRTALIVALLCASLGALAQTPARVQSLAWLAGTWVSESARGTVTESWLGPGHGMMAAVNLSTFRNGRDSYEFLRIADTPAGISYFASPDGVKPVEFPLKESGAQRVVFENPAHDFPQRILYWRDGAALVARIEGTVKGKERSEEWRFEKLKLVSDTNSNR